MAQIGDGALMGSIVLYQQENQENLTAVNGSSANSRHHRVEESEAMITAAKLLAYSPTIVSVAIAGSRTLKKMRFCERSASSSLPISMAASFSHSWTAAIWRRGVKKSSGPVAPDEALQRVIVLVAQQWRKMLVAKARGDHARFSIRHTDADSGASRPGDCTQVGVMPLAQLLA